VDFFPENVGTFLQTPTAQHVMNGDMRTLKSMGMSMGDGGGATGTKSGVMGSGATGTASACSTRMALSCSSFFAAAAGQPTTRFVNESSSTVFLPHAVAPAILGSQAIDSALNSSRNERQRH
jgi:hypothetical protein